MTYCILEKRRPNGRFFLGPAGSCLGYAQLLFLSIWGMAARGAALCPPIKVFPSVIKIIGKLENRKCSWEEYWSSERPCGCQEQLLFWWLLQKLSLNPSRFHLSSISGIRSLKDRKGSWEESWCSGRPYECQEQFLFSCPHQKILFNPSRFHLSSISGVGSMDDRKGSRQKFAF